jgi:ABC-2 type transport system ATP-binding protein
MADVAIRTTGLSKSYGDTVALRNLDLTIDSGEIFGLLGHNGAGKTTAVNLLTTLLEPSSGSMQVAGVDTAADPNGVRRVIGYLPENVQFYDNLTTMENLRFFARLSGLSKPDARIGEVLEYLDFTGHDDQRVGSFSKGMRQRVGIAQAILHKPSVLFLDEPTSGLDPEGVRQLRDVIVALNRDLGMTIFMNTHLLSEVTKTCTSIGILRQGELAYHASLAATLEAFPGEDSLEEIYLNIRSAPAS